MRRDPLPPPLDRLVGGLLLALSLAACAAPRPAPPPPPAPVAAPPTRPLSAGEYLATQVDYQVLEVYVGAPAYRAALHWQVAGRLTNRGPRPLVRVDARFTFPETGHQERVAILDPLQEHQPLGPGESREFQTVTARLQFGTKTPVTQGQLASLAPPPVEVQLVDLQLGDE
ncbi:MAG: hypothetical protein RBU45_10850 [Myxococcota bacterium]|jgi:hypothetical protein|nr:hypothetical protein [Myxococcota bacterium]